MKKSLAAFLLVAATLLSTSVPAMATDGSSSDIPTADLSAPESEEPVTEADAPAPVTDGSYQDTEKIIVSKIISDGMSDYDKLVAITKYAAYNFSYSSNYTVNTLITSGSGNCIANTYFILDLCALVGIEAWYRSASRDPGTDATHVCAIAKIGDTYYTADAGYSGTKPRSFRVTERPNGFSVSDGVLYQYDGVNVTDLIIPAQTPSATTLGKNGTNTIAGTTITQIGYSGEECFSYGGVGLRSITLPATVKTVTATAFKGCKDLENIYVDAANPYFTSIDGVLYSKDLTRLVCVPAKKTSVTIPSTVKSQDPNAFYGGSIPVTVSAGATPFQDVPADEWYADSVSFVYTHSLFMGTSDTAFSPNTRMTRGMFITVLGRFAGGGKWSALEEWSGTLGVSGASQIAVRDRTTTSGSTVLTRITSSDELVKVLSTVPEGEDGAVWYNVQYGLTTGYVRRNSTAANGSTLLHVYTGDFTDLSPGSYYTGYAQWASAFGVMYGMTDTTFCPNLFIKRQDICVLLYRYLTACLDKAPPTNGSAFADDGAISGYARDAVYAMRAIGVVSGYPDNTFRPDSYATRAEVAAMFQSLYDYLN